MGTVDLLDVTDLDQLKWERDVFAICLFRKVNEEREEREWGRDKVSEEDRVEGRNRGRE